MKTTSSLVLALIAIFSFLQAAKAAITPVSTSFFGNGGMRSFLFASFDSTDITPPTNNIIGIHVKFPGDFPAYNNHYGEFKCGGAFNQDDTVNRGVVPILNYPFTKTSSAGFTYVTTSINLHHAMGRNAGVTALVPANTLLLKNFRIYCTYAAPMPTYGVSPVTFTATIDGATYSISGSGENKPRVVPNKNLGLFISYTYSLSQPTTLNIRGVYPVALHVFLTLRNPPATRSYNVTPFDFFEYDKMGTMCEIYKNGIFHPNACQARVMEPGGTYNDGQAVRFQVLEAWSDYKDYDIYCNNLRGAPGWDDFGEHLGRYSPSMLELDFEGTHFYFNTAYTQHIPVPNFNVAAAASAPTSVSSDSYITAEDTEIENEVAEMIPYHISNYANYHETHDVPAERGDPPAFDVLKEE